MGIVDVTRRWGVDGRDFKGQLVDMMVRDGNTLQIPEDLISLDPQKPTARQLVSRRFPSSQKYRFFERG